MITHLHGQLDALFPTHAILDVGGIGYNILIPSLTYSALEGKEGQTIKILTHLIVREDAHLLYGFATAEERNLFQLLFTRVSGVGPKMALAAISGRTPDEFKALVVANDIAGISKIKGIGKKTAEMIILELRDKVGVTDTWASRAKATPAEGPQYDAILTLISLGYKKHEAQEAVKTSLTPKTTQTTEQIIKGALAALCIK